MCAAACSDGRRRGPVERTRPTPTGLRCWRRGGSPAAAVTTNCCRATRGTRARRSGARATRMRWWSRETNPRRSHRHTQDGSTSIQGMLQRLVGPLGRLGIHVPSSGRGGGAHASLSFVYPGSPLYGRAHRAWAALRDELRRHPAPRFVISSETFSLCAADHVASRVSDLADTVGLDVEVVAYVRPQYQALEAGYAESIKMGFHTAGFGTILEQLADWPLRLSSGLPALARQIWGPPEGASARAVPHARGPAGSLSRSARRR